MAEENEKEVKQPKAGGKLMIVLIVLIVILLIAIGIGSYFLFSSNTFNNQQGQNQQTQSTKGNSLKGSFRANVNDLVLNITSSKGREKLMKLSFSIRSVEPEIESLVEEYKAEIIDAVISQISSRSSEELLTVGGKALLKEELIEELNTILNEVSADNKNIKKDNIKNILFTTFVIK